MPILRSLVAKLCKEATADGEQGVFLCVLATVGDLAAVGGAILKNHLPELLPIVIDALHDNGSQVFFIYLYKEKETYLKSYCHEKMHIESVFRLTTSNLIDTGFIQIGPKKQEVAISALARLIESTGAVIQPYHDYPHLMYILVNLISSDISSSARLKTIRVLGCLGALDPHDHKKNRRRLLQGMMFP